jgi:methionyl-tRNA formyltransferase
MRTLLITSAVTFVPRNYDDMIAGLAECPQVAGLLVLDNANYRLMGQACGLIALGAPRVGWTLLKNRFGTSRARRRRAYAAQGKPLWRLRSINSEAAARLIREQNIDLIVNARTRSIYRQEILALPRLGCVNVHHGLLPEQRGTMCDLWALHERVAAGFSIHKMVEKVDAGEILARVEVSDGSDRDYLRYLGKAAKRELAELKQLLAEIERQGAVAGQRNSTANPQYRRNPTRQQIAAMKKGGLIL